MIHDVRPHILAARVNLYTNDKLIQESKYKWTLKRLGLKRDSIIIVNPTSYNGWYWNTVEWYRDNLLKNIALEILKQPGAIISLEQIIQIFGETPKPIKVSMKVLLKSYPERFYTRTDITTGSLWVAISNGWQLPSYETAPINMGVIEQYNPRRFDWEEYASIDSMARVKVNINMPATPYRFQISGRCGVV